VQRLPRVRNDLLRVSRRTRHSSSNPARSRIRIVREPLKDIYLPVYAGEYTMSECTGRTTYMLDGKEYSECDFCRASCPSRDLFKEPDSGLPLKCDMCEDTPALAVPKCVECVWLKPWSTRSARRKSRKNRTSPISKSASKR
jgi:hypothetical protein